MPTKSPKALYVIFLTIFIDLVGVGILIPVIPQLLGNPASTEYLLPAGMSVQTGYMLLGLLVAIYPLGAFIASPLLGQLSDRFGRRPILIVSLFGTALGYALFAYAIATRNIPLLFAGRIIDGLTGGNMPVAQATIADLSTPENRAKNFGRMGALFGLGFVLGPWLGGQLASPQYIHWFTAATPFWFAAILSFINMISLWILLPETSPRVSREPLHWAKSIKDIVKAFTDPKLSHLFIVGFLFFSGFGFFTTMFGVYLLKHYGFDQGATGNFFAYVGIWIAIAQAFVTPWVSKRWSESRVLNVTFICTSFALMIYLLPAPWEILLVATPFFAILNGLTQANYLAFLSRSASPEVQGQIMGINASVGMLSQFLPPILSGYIAAKTFPEFSIYVAIAIIFFAGLLFIFTVKHDDGKPHAQAKPAMGH